MKRSFVNSESSKTISPFKSPDIRESQIQTFQFNKNLYTQVTIETLDKDVPYIAIYKPDQSIQRRKVHSAVKIVNSLRNFQLLRVFRALNKIADLGPRQKSNKIKTHFLGCIFLKMLNKRMQKPMKSLIVNKIKKNGIISSAKMIWRIQNAVLQRNLKHSMAEVRRNRLLVMIRELSNENQLGNQLKKTRTDLLKLKDQGFSQQFINIAKTFQKINTNEIFIETLTEQKFANILKSQTKRFQQIRYSGTPRRKDVFNSQVVLSVTSNILSSYQGRLKDYQLYCQQLQSQLAGYKDSEGISQLKELIEQKDNAMKEIESFINEISRLDVELKKFTLQNKFQSDKVTITLAAHDKKMENKLKNLQGVNSKISSSRSYLTSVVSILLKKLDKLQLESRDAESQKKQFENTSNQSIRKLQNQLSKSTNQLEQIKNKLNTFLEKKQNKSALTGLKRTWKDSQQFKILVDYGIAWIQKVQQMESEQRSNNSKRESQIKKSVNQISRIITNSLQEANAGHDVNLKPEGIDDALGQLLNPIQQVFQYAQRLKSQHQASISQNKQKDQSIYLESEVKIIRPEVNIQEYQKNIAERLFQHLNKLSESSEKRILQKHSSEKDVHSFQQDDTYTKIINQMRILIKQLERKLLNNNNNNRTIDAKIKKLENEVNNLQKINSQLKSQNNELLLKLEQEKALYLEQIRIIENQCTEKINLITSQYTDKFNTITNKISQKIGGIANQQGSNTRVLNQKNEQLLIKQLQLQEEIINLKSQLQSNSSLHQYELARLKEENSSLKAKIEENQGRQTEKINSIISQYTQKINRLSQDNNSNILLANQKNEQLILKKSQLQEEIISLKTQLQLKISQHQFQTAKLKQQNSSLKSRMSQIQNKQTEKISTIINQYTQKMGGLNNLQHSNSRLMSQKNQQLLAKQFQLQEQIINIKSQFESSLSQHQYQVSRLKEENNSLKVKITQFESQNSRKQSDILRIQNRLKQTEQTLTLQREKVNSLYGQITNMELQLGRCHNQSDKLANETREEVRKITTVMRSMEEQLQNKTKTLDNLQSKSANQQKTIAKLENQIYQYKENLSYSQHQLETTIMHCHNFQQKNMQLTSQLTHLKAQFFSLQVQLQSNQSSKLHTVDQVSLLQSEIKEKQGTINNILEQSKVNSSNLNLQLFEAREHLVDQERRYQEQLAVKSALINRLQHQIIQHENNIRALEQHCIILEQNAKRTQIQLKHDSKDTKDKQIELLRQQISSLQSFLANMSHQYKQLQIKYQQEKIRFSKVSSVHGNSYQYQNSMEEIDKAIHSLADNSNISQQVKSLVINNEMLQVSIEELQEQRMKLIQKARSLPERQYVVELLFNLLLGAGGLSVQSPKGNAIWNQLIKINETYEEVGELFSELQKFCLKVMSSRN